MGGVICLANFGIYLQSGFAASYMLLNIFCWIVAALPPARHWDLSRLQVTEIKVKGGFPAENRNDDTTPTTYTEALWKAIAITAEQDGSKKQCWRPRPRPGRNGSSKPGMRRMWSRLRRRHLWTRVRGRRWPHGGFRVGMPRRRWVCF
jgi:hypothetical protein